MGTGTQQFPVAGSQLPVLAFGSEFLVRRFTVPGSRVAVPGFRFCFPVRSSESKLLPVRGAAQLDAERMTMEQLASSLRSIVEKPVIDRTGLTGAYRFTLEIPSPMAGRGGLTTARDRTPILPEPSGVDVFRSIERLGLKLRRSGRRSRWS